LGGWPGEHSDRSCKEPSPCPKVNSTDLAAQSKPVKPSKPYRAFPLTAHPAGYWCKKIRGKLHYFGKWADPDAALRKYLEQKDALHAGRKPREATKGATVHELVNRFLIQKQALVDVRELSPRTWTGYKQACDEVVASFGKRQLLVDLLPEDFSRLRNKLARTNGPHRLGSLIQCVRCLFMFAYDAGIVSAPIRFGAGFKRPNKKTMRLHKAKQGPRLFSADEVKKLLDVASPTMKAMILLGINAGFGNGDCGNLPLATLDLESGWVNYPRPKTGIGRRCPLWPETVQALKEALANRPEPKDPADAGLVFFTKYGFRWTKDIADSPITKETRKLLDGLGLNGHRNFSCLRHSFRTVADEAKVQPAADFIMGHESPHLSSHYREGNSDERLMAVVDVVRKWLFGTVAQVPQ